MRIYKSSFITMTKLRVHKLQRWDFILIDETYHSKSYEIT